jgi:DNA-binding beta-propeller fold protein YncE
MTTMHRTRFAVLTLGALLATGVAPAWGAAFRLLSTTHPSSAINPATLIEIDLMANTRTVIGMVGASTGSLAIDFNPLTGELLGTDAFAAPGVVHRIDPSTGVSTAMGTVHDAAQNALPVEALAFGPGGAWYAAVAPVTGSQYSIGTIDPMSLAYSPVVILAPGVRPAGIDVSAAGVLYAVQTQASGHTLARYDAATLDALDAAPITGTAAVADIDYAPDGFIYHSALGNALVRIDPATATQSIANGGTVGALAGVASTAVPLPAAAWLLLGGLCGLRRFWIAR